MSTNLPQKSQFLVYQAENGQVKIDVRLENETVWLTQPLMAELFQTSVPNISMHIRNIYGDGELMPEATLKEFLTVRREGNRDVQRQLDYYNLDMIIAESKTALSDFDKTVKRISPAKRGARK